MITLYLSNTGNSSLPTEITEGTGIIINEKIYTVKDMNKTAKGNYTLILSFIDEVYVTMEVNSDYVIAALFH